MTMRKQLLCGVICGLLLAGGLALTARDKAEAANEEDGPMLSHDVYFTLKDNTAAARKKLVAACKKYLTKHPGEFFFAAGARVQDLKREVNDQDFDVALHIVFRTRAVHDKYQDAERHKQFIEENKESWKKVRVFDSTAEK
jgi:hypothetical protein